MIFTLMELVYAEIVEYLTLNSWYIYEVVDFNIKLDRSSNLLYFSLDFSTSTKKICTTMICSNHHSTKTQNSICC